VRDQTRPHSVEDSRALPKTTRRTIAAVALMLCFAGTGGMCRDGTTAPLDTCSAAREYAERHIVAWPEPIARPILDRLLAGEAPAVRFDGCGIELVEACKVRGEAYVRATRQDIHYDPWSGRASFAAPPDSPAYFSSSLRSREITIDHRAAVGVSDVRRSNASECEEATHIIVQVTVGAYKAVESNEPPLLGGDVHSCQLGGHEAEPPPPPLAAPTAADDREASTAVAETVDDPAPAESAPGQPDAASTLDRMTASQCRTPVTIQLVPIPSGELTTPQCLDGEHLVDGKCVAEKLEKYRVPPGDPVTGARFQQVIAELEPLSGTERAAKLYELAQLYRGLPSAEFDTDVALVLGEYVELTTNTDVPHPERRDALHQLLAVAVRTFDDAATGLASALIVSEFPTHPDSPVAFLELARYYCRKGDSAFAQRTVDNLVYLHGRRKSTSKKSPEEPKRVHPAIREALAENFETCPPASK
jgi:hypothetical protein